MSNWRFPPQLPLPVLGDVVGDDMYVMPVAVDAEVEVVVEAVIIELPLNADDWLIGKLGLTPTSASHAHYPVSVDLLWEGRAHRYVFDAGFVSTLSETTLSILGLCDIRSHTSFPTMSNSPIATLAFWILIISRIRLSSSSRSPGALATQRASANTRTTVSAPDLSSQIVAWTMILE